MFKRKPTVSTDKAAIEEFLTRGVDTVYPDKKWLKAALESGRRLRIYTGIDPTSTDVHIGHTVWMWKLKQLQDLGHEIVVLLGTFTATIGDPTGKDAARNQLTQEQVEANIKDFQKKVAPIFGSNKQNPVVFKRNGDWLSTLTFADVIKLASEFTVQQMLERDMFENRVKDGKPIYMHEFFYPLMQGYDSVAMDVDLEIGATDQTFNMLAGRTLQKRLNNKDKGVLTTALLTDASGRKIGKSEGNAINIDLPANDLYGKVMTLGDEVIWSCFEMCTNVPMDEIATLKKDLKDDPRNAKARLAWEVTRIFHSAKDADAAQEAFNAQFKDGGLPEDMPELSVSSVATLVDALVESELCSSKSDARRQVKQGAVKLDGEVVSDIDAPATPGVLQKGKRHFVKLV